MMKKSLAIFWLLAVVLVGCDIDLLGEKREARRREAEDRAQQEERRRETEAMRDAMTKYVTGHRQAAQKRLDEVSKEDGDLRGDLAKLTSAMASGMAEKDTKGNDQKYETKILHILKDAEVNALATKHLASDFAGVVATYIERVREARAADARYAAALRDAEKLYQSGIQESKDWSKRTKEQQADEISRLEREIVRLEASLEKVRKENKSVTRNVVRNSQPRTPVGRELWDAKETLDNRFRDLERQLSVKRNQLDRLRNPREQNFTADRAVVATQQRQEDAIRIRDRAFFDINRNMKPAKSLTDVVAEFEKDTVGKLRTVLADKISKIEAEMQSLKSRIAAADEALLAIPISEIGDLKSIRSKFDRR